jgi:hypothetical protein
MRAPVADAPSDDPHALPPPAPAIEFEEEPTAPAGHYGAIRLVLRPNGYALDTPGEERTTYRGAELWDEATWAALAECLGRDDVHDAVRQTVFQYVADALPTRPAQLHWDREAGAFRIVPGGPAPLTAYKPVGRAARQVQRAAERLVALLAPLPPRAGPAARTRAELLKRIEIGAGFRGPTSRPGLPHPYADALWAVVEPLPALARRAATWQVGGHRACDHLTHFVWHLAAVYEFYRAEPARPPYWDGGNGRYTSDFFTLVERIADALPALPGTLGAVGLTARGKAIARAFAEIRARAQAVPDKVRQGELMAPRTVAALLSR